MGSLEERLRRLEARTGDGDKRSRAFGEFLRSLTDSELHWLLEPSDEAKSLVPCPRFEPVECGCGCEGRRKRGFAAHPELVEEYTRRLHILLEDKGAVM